MVGSMVVHQPESFCHQEKKQASRVRRGTSYKDNLQAKSIRVPGLSRQKVNKMENSCMFAGSEEQSFSEVERTWDRLGAGSGWRGRQGTLARGRGGVSR